VDSWGRLELRDAIDNNGGDEAVVIEVRLEPMVMLGVLDALEIVCDPMGRSFSDGEAQRTLALLSQLREALEPRRATIQRAIDAQLEALF
jgi:endonuclease/exonuclease/phosphatase (EEP) superfamily protein YafD